jgi:hypothetical protein
VDQKAGYGFSSTEDICVLGRNQAKLKCDFGFLYLTVDDEWIWEGKKSLVDLLSVRKLDKDAWVPDLEGLGVTTKRNTGSTYMREEWQRADQKTYSDDSSPSSTPRET